MSELRAEENDVASTVCESQHAETIIAAYGIHAFRGVADDVQLKLLDGMETLKETISETGASNAADSMELRCALLFISAKQAWMKRLIP